jgi:hypothetical protein
LILSLAVILPWTARNYSVFRQFVPVTTQFGVNFWIGNNDKATGTDYFEISSTDSSGYTLMTHTLPKSTMDSLAGMNEIGRMKYYLKEGTGFMIQRPLAFFRLLIKKAYYYWLFAPAHEYSSKDLAKYRVMLLIFYLPVLLLSIGGILFLGPRLKDAGLVLLLMALISGTYILTHVGLARYRVILEPYMMIFAAGFKLERVVGISGSIVPRRQAKA